MLDKMLEVAYSTEQKKTASRALVDKLKELPLEELQRYVDGDENCKLAYALAVDGAKMAGDSDFCWLDKYKGTPFFTQAVELEKQLLQLDAEDQAQREQERASRPSPSDTWAKRDALQLQKRMLDLDFIMAQNGGDPTTAAPEAAPEAAPSPDELSTADAPELALEQGGPLAAPKGPPAGEAPPAAGGEPSEEELMAALEAEGGGGEAPPAPPQEKGPPKPKAQEGEDEEEEDEAEKGAPPKKDEKPPAEKSEKMAAQVLASVKVGQLLAKCASGETKLKREIAKKHPGLAKQAADAPEGHHVRRFLLGNPISSAIEAKPGSRMDAYGEASGHVLSESVKGGLKGGLWGAGLGGAGGLALALANKGDPKKALGYGAGLGGLAGLIGGDTYGALKGHHGAEASRIHGARSKHNAPEEKVAFVGGLVAAAKPVMSQLGNVANAGKSLATSAYAKGGMGQVASSFGNVAKNFAQKNPLAAAGIAGAGGLAAGKMLSNSRA